MAGCRKGKNDYQYGGPAAQCPVALAATVDDDVVIALLQAEQVVANIALELNAVYLVPLRVVVSLLEPVRCGELWFTIDQQDHDYLLSL